jgi:magnesium chelatase family protein
MLGTPKVGTSSLDLLTPVLPAMTLAEAIETTRIHRVAGLTGRRTALVTTRPFQEPHHTNSDVGPVGSGTWPPPGVVSLVRHGVLFLDERPECRGHVLEVLRQLFEDGSYMYTLASVLNLCVFAALALRIMTAKSSRKTQ